MGVGGTCLSLRENIVPVLKENVNDNADKGYGREKRKVLWKHTGGGVVRKGCQKEVIFRLSSKDEWGSVSEARKGSNGFPSKGRRTCKAWTWRRAAPIVMYNQSSFTFRVTLLVPTHSLSHFGSHSFLNYHSKDCGKFYEDNLGSLDFGEKHLFRPLICLRTQYSGS